MRTLDAGLFVSFDGERIGRGTRLPPQFGQRPLNLWSTQSRQNVHSNEQIIAFAAVGGKSLLQHSQLGRSSSILILTLKSGSRQFLKQRHRMRTAAPPTETSLLKSVSMG
jgi:hypothetical protein